MKSLSPLTTKTCDKINKTNCRIGSLAIARAERRNDGLVDARVFNAVERGFLSGSVVGR
jgi:hypothetical protein